jgi:hypothetical protein
MACALYRPRPSLPGLCLPECHEVERATEQLSCIVTVDACLNTVVGTARYSYDAPYSDLSVSRHGRPRPTSLAARSPLSASEIANDGVYLQFAHKFSNDNSRRPAHGGIYLHEAIDCFTSVALPEQAWENALVVVRAH